MRDSSGPSPALQTVNEAHNITRQRRSPDLPPVEAYNICGVNAKERRAGEGLLLCCWQSMRWDHATGTYQVPILCDSCPILSRWACVNISCSQGRSSGSNGPTKVRMHPPTLVKNLLHAPQIRLPVMSSAAGAITRAADSVALALWSVVPTDLFAPFGSAIQPMPQALPVCSMHGESCKGTRPPYMVCQRTKPGLRELQLCSKHGRLRSKGSMACPS